MHIPHSSKILILLALWLGSCDTSTQKNGEQVASSPSEKTSVSPEKSQSKSTSNLRTIEKKNTPCKDEECTRVSIKLPVFGNAENTEKLEPFIEQKAAQLLSDYVMNANAEMDLDKIMDVFIEGYNEFKATFPEAKAAWYINMEIVQTYTSDDFISMKFTSDSYTGGAHGNTESIYYNMSPKGKELSRLSYFIRDKGNVQQMAEVIFRKNNNLTADESLNASGFMFVDDTFTLPENFGFNETGIVFHYNNYEIASYATGSTEIVIPYGALGENYRF